MGDRGRENLLTQLLIVLGCFEFIISLITSNITQIVNSLSVIVLSFFLCDADNHHYQDGAGPLLLVLPCFIIIFIICELINIGNDINKIYLSLSSQNEHMNENIIYIIHLIISVLYFIIFKKLFN